jgi:hypothetical protein
VGQPPPDLHVETADLENFSSTTAGMADGFAEAQASVKAAMALTFPGIVVGTGLPDTAALAKLTTNSLTALNDIGTVTSLLQPVKDLAQNYAEQALATQGDLTFLQYHVAALATGAKQMSANYTAAGSDENSSVADVQTMIVTAAANLNTSPGTPAS